MSPAYFFSFVDPVDISECNFLLPIRGFELVLRICFLHNSGILQEDGQNDKQDCIPNTSVVNHDAMQRCALTETSKCQTNKPSQELGDPSTRT